MKKFLSVFLILALLTSSLSLVACNDEKKRDDKKQTESSTQPSDTGTPDGTDTSDNTSTPEDTSKPDDVPDEPDMTPGSIDNPVYLSDEPYTLTLEAGAVFYVAVKNPGNQKVVIDNPNAKILYNEVVYEADTAGLEIPLVAASSDGRQSAILEVSSKDGAAASFTVCVEAMPGTMGNPIPLIDLGDLNVVTAKDQTLYYSWTATTNGNFTVQAKTAVSNFVMMIDNRTTGENKGATEATLGVLSGETVIIAVRTVSGNPVEGGLDYSFSMQEADATADFNFSVTVSALSDGAIAGVSVELYSRVDDTLVTVLTTDADGTATYTAPWSDLYAKIIVPDGYTILSDNDDTTDDLLSDFHPTSGLFGNATVVFTLISAE